MEGCQVSIKLYPFQAEDYKIIVNRFNLRAYVGFEPGLGKTVISIKAVLDHVTGPTLVVAPAGAKVHWSREFAAHVGKRADILGGRKPAPLSGKGSPVYVINYENLWAWKEVMRELRPEMVIIDEAQRIKDPNAKCSRAAKEICRLAHVPKIMMLSGTPMPNRPIELWFPVSILRPDLFPSMIDYGKIYCAGVKRFGYWDFSGSSNEKELNTILINEVMVRRKKVDVLAQLPSLTSVVMPFDLRPSDRREYDKARGNFLDWLATKDKKKARNAIGQEEVTKLGYLLRLAAMLKVPDVVAWVKEFLESGEKLILFCHHHDFVDAVHEKFEDVSLVVTGDTPMRLRQTIFDRFNDDPSVKLLIGNIQAAGVFWSCRSTSTVAFGELDWVPGNIVQAIDRVRGIKRGTGKPVTAYYLTAANTIEDKLCEVLERKTAVLDAVIDGKKSGDLELFTYLIEALKREGRPAPIRAKKKEPSPPKKGKLPWPLKKRSPLLKGGKSATARRRPFPTRKRSPWPRRK